MTKKLFIIYWLLFFATMALGQNDRKQVSNFLKLEHYVVRVTELVRKFREPRAVEYITNARIALEQARGFLFQQQPPRYGLARLQMVRAKNFTDLAAKIVLSRPFAYLKSQLDEMINQADRRVADLKSDEAHYLLNQAKKYRRNAYLAFTSKNLSRGQEFFRISFFFAQKCLEFTSQGGRDITAQIQDLVASIRQLLLQAEDLLSDNSRANLRNLVEDAQTYFEEAIRLAEEGKQEVALKRLRLVKRLLYRIFDFAERSDSSADTRLESSLYTLRALLQSLENDMEESADPQAKKILGKAWELFEQAERAFQSGQYGEAKAKITLSQRFANKVFRMNRGNPNVDRDNLEYQLNQTQQLLDIQKNEIEKAGRPVLEKLHGDALNILENARQALIKNRPAVAFQLVQAATRMASRIQRELNSGTAGFQKAELLSKYHRIQTMLRQLGRNRDLAARYENILNQLQQFANRGKEYLDQDQFILADEYFNTVLEQIKRYMETWN